MKLIERKEYLDELSDLRWVPDIKVITGIRRCGKSKLMEALISDIAVTDSDSNIIHVNFNDSSFENLCEYQALEEYVEEHFEKEKNNYLLVDEIQMCKSFEKAINSLHSKEKYDIYVTGSNALLQSSSLATLFVGRCYEIHAFPFSFTEYLSYYPSENKYGSLTEYMENGGMSGSFLYRTDRQKYRYLNEEVLNALVIRDIVNKYKIRNEPLLHSLIDYLMDNIGNITSVRTITNTLKSNNTKADHKTIGNYIDHLCSAFAFYRIRRYDIKGKRYLRSEDKYYLCDHSFRYARLGTRNMDYGRVLENIIAMELLRRYSEVYVGKLYSTEVDFVVIDRGEKKYIQVAYDISDKNTLRRELNPLLKIKDSYPKIVIARTYQPEYQIEGIGIIDAADWLTTPIPQK